MKIIKSKWTIRWIHLHTDEGANFRMIISFRVKFTITKVERDKMGISRARWIGGFVTFRCLINGIDWHKLAVTIITAFSLGNLYNTPGRRKCFEAIILSRAKYPWLYLWKQYFTTFAHMYLNALFQIAHLCFGLLFCEHKTGVLEVNDEHTTNFS